MAFSKASEYSDDDTLGGGPSYRLDDITLSEQEPVLSEPPRAARADATDKSTESFEQAPAAKETPASAAEAVASESAAPEQGAAEPSGEQAEAPKDDIPAE